MKKNVFMGLVVVLGLIGCTRNQEVDIQENGLTLVARTESPADTKTVVEEGVHVFWEPGDEIAVFMGEKMAKFSTDLTAASGTATFKGTFGNESWPEELDLWAVYPYSEEAVFDGETITTVLPSEQVAREGSFGKDMNLAIAHSNSSTLQFYNVGGGIRFSVTEEGIKKVMFEGLSGEIISGKVKIGFSEDGKPTVQEVSSGSQFITLLPPPGKETFEPGTWYYIVAIPGSLEGGYKLRFYKDSDYARKVSEKAVEIKRSIFGNVEKADDGIEYVTTTMKFPETEEEWKVSTELTERISVRIRHIFSDILKTSADSVINTNSFIQEATRIDGVARVIPTESDGVAIVQNNGVHINVIYDYLYGWENSNPQLLSQKDAREGDTSMISRAIAPSGPKIVALYSPFQTRNTGIKSPMNVNVNNLQSILSEFGYDLWYFPDDNASLNSILPYNMCNLRLIFFVTHGNYKHPAYDQEGKVRETVMFTGQRIGTIDFSTEQNQHLATFILNDGVYYAITPTWLTYIENTTGISATYNQSIVFALGCNTFVNSDFANFFLDRGASVYVGDSFRIDSNDSRLAIDALMKYLTMGVSVRKACEMIKKDFSFWGQVFYPIKVSDEPLGTSYFIDSTPTSLRHSINKDKCTFYWEMPKTSGSYQFKVHFNGTIYDSHTTRAFTTESLPPGKYTWSVEANLIYDGKVIESFLSSEDEFIIIDGRYETPKAIDLGLSVKWATFNLGATKPEELGCYYAWGDSVPLFDHQYTWDSYKWCKGSQNTLTKYCTDPTYGYNGFTDNKTVLDLEDDAANIHLKGHWRTPTFREWVELRDSCNWTWITDYNGSGISGYKVQSKIAGYTKQYIFIPAAGYPWTQDNGVGLYMSSIIADYNLPYSFCDYYFTSSQLGYGGSQYRNQGSSIRPVYDE